MITMKCDMAGAAAVATTTLAIARLGIPVKVTACPALAENMPSGAAQRAWRRAHHVQRHDGRGAQHRCRGTTRHGGRDCPGPARTPDVLVDVATLTGAQTIALGTHVSAIMANDDELRDRVAAAAEPVGESMWPMPLPPGCDPVEFQGADLANIGERMGGMLTAGLFPVRVRHLGDVVGRIWISRAWPSMRITTRIHACGWHGYRGPDAGCPRWSSWRTDNQSITRLAARSPCATGGRTLDRSGRMTSMPRDVRSSVGDRESVDLHPMRGDVAQLSQDTTGEFDVVILGGRSAADMPVLFERPSSDPASPSSGKLGGTRPHNGCIPTKALHAAEVADETAPGFQGGVPQPAHGHRHGPGEQVQGLGCRPACARARGLVCSAGHLREGTGGWWPRTPVEVNGTRYVSATSC